MSQIDDTKTYDIYFKFTDALRASGWKKDFSEKTRKSFPDHDVFTKRFSIYNITAYVSTSFYSCSFWLRCSMPRGVDFSRWEEFSKRLTKTWDDFRTVTMKDVEEAAKKLASEAKAIAPPRKRLDTSKMSVYDRSKGEYIEGDAALEIWKSRAEEIIKDIFERHDTLFSTEFVVNNMFNNYFHEPEYPMTRDQGARLVRRLLEKLAKQKVIDKCEGGYTIEWVRHRD